MTVAIIHHVVEGGIGIAGPFDSKSEARAWMAEHSSGDGIESYEDPTVAADFTSNTEPQEMTASWARRMARAS